MDIPIYNYPTLGLACHWHAICQQLSACLGIVKDLVENSKEGLELAKKDMEKLEEELKQAKSDFLIKNLKKDINRLKCIEASREFLIQTLVAVHDEGGYRRYCNYGVPTLVKAIDTYYDIHINSSEMIMLDSAKIYQYCLQYFVKKTTLYVSTDNDIRSTKDAILKYKPIYLLIPITELRANTTLTVGKYTYTLISVSKGSGHFFCDHIKPNGDALQFDDRSPKNTPRRHRIEDILMGIKQNEIVIQRRGHLLKKEVINALRETAASSSDTPTTVTSEAESSMSATSNEKSKVDASTTVTSDEKQEAESSTAVTHDEKQKVDTLMSATSNEKSKVDASTNDKKSEEHKQYTLELNPYDITDEDMSQDDCLYKTINKIFVNKGFDLDKDINKEEALEKFKGNQLFTDIITHLDDKFTWMKIGGYIESHKQEFYSNEVFTAYGYDQRFYGMAMLLRTNPVGFL